MEGGLGVSTGELPKIFVARTLLGDALGRLEQIGDVFVWPEPRPPSAAEFIEHAAGADAIVTMVTDRVDEAVLEHCPSLRVVANVAAGYDNFDVPALTRRRIPAGNTPDVLTNSTADMAFALLLASARRVVEGRDAVLAGEWTVWDPALMLGLELSGRRSRSGRWPFRCESSRPHVRSGPSRASPTSISRRCYARATWCRFTSRFPRRRAI
jgi:lactate dehydrogenase-like 2-hydroxyacid dehydrogenase